MGEKLQILIFSFSFLYIGDFLRGKGERSGVKNGKKRGSPEEPHLRVVVEGEAHPRGLGEAEKPFSVFPAPPDLLLSPSVSVVFAVGLDAEAAGAVGAAGLFPHLW